MVQGYKNISVVLISIFSQLSWGLTILITGVVPMTTSIAPIANLVGQSRIVGGIFVTTAILAVIALYQQSFSRTFSLIVWQHIVLMYSMASSVLNIFLGHYSDGFVPMSDNGVVTFNSHLFIWADQARAIIFAIFYSLSLRNVYANTMNTLVMKAVEIKVTIVSKFKKYK